MQREEIIRAWKDESFRATLDETPAHPAGMLELEDDDLEDVAGADTAISAIVISAIVSAVTVVLDDMC